MPLENEFDADERARLWKRIETHEQDIIFLKDEVNRLKAEQSRLRVLVEVNPKANQESFLKLQNP